MRKITFLLHVAVLSFLSTNGQIAFQGFEGAVADNWSYTSNIAPYTIANGAGAADDDFWKIVSGQMINFNNITVVNSAHTGTKYFAGLDLDNPHAEAAKGGDTTPDHYLDFDAVNIGGVSVDFSVWFDFHEFDSSDFIFYEFFYNNGADWSSPDVHVDINAKPSDPTNLSSEGGTWQRFTTNIPPGNTYVRVRIGVYQNGGGDGLGFDDISLETATVLSATKNTIIEGLSYGPNPTENTVIIKANSIIGKATVYNLIGKQVYEKVGNSSKMSLDLKNQPKGMYYVKVVSEGKTETISVVRK